ncbi:MAG: hypothetical protein QXJ45_08260 [Thermoproteota archaeon]
MYKEFLENWHIFELQKNCAQEGYKTTCPRCGHVVYRAKYCGKRRTCPICGNRFAYGKAKSALDFFTQVNKKFEKVRVIQLVFTTPRLVWCLDEVRVFDGLSRVIRRTLEKYFGGVAGGLIEFHYWHSENPLGGFYPHAHVFIINYVWDGQKYRRINSRLNLGLLRMVYRKELMKEFKIEIDGEVNLWSRFYRLDGESEKDNKRLMHALYYAFRPALHDVLKFFSMYGRTAPLADHEVGRLWELLLPRVRRTRWIGFLSNGCRVKIGVKLRRVKVEIDRCPVCGAKLTGVWDRCSLRDVDAALVVDRPPPLP